MRSLIMGVLDDGIAKAKKDFAPGSENKRTEKEVIDKFGKIFSKNHIDELTWDEFRDFTLYKHNHHWTNMNRSNGFLKRDFKILKEALKVLLDETLPINERLKKTLPKDAPLKAEGTGPALFTSILTVSFPQKYAVYNNTTINAANSVLPNENFSKPNFIDEYEHFNEITKDIANKNGLTLWEMDWVWDYIIRTQSGDVGTDSSDEENSREGVNEGGMGPDYEMIQLPINIILYGPVGTGKTLLANKLAMQIIDGKITNMQQVRQLLDNNFEETSIEDNHLIRNVTFHKSYGYEQFIEGIFPETDRDGRTSFGIRDGIFKSFSNLAKESLEKGEASRFVMVIDEINRGDISRIFGELITLIEKDKRKRGIKSPGMEIELLYSQEKFSVPINLFLIGTMNTTDKSIALLDLALRRRFYFVEVRPSINVLKKYVEGLEEELKSIVIFIFQKLNEKIREYKGEDYGVGHAYFMEIGSGDDLIDIWNFRIMPLLKEYFYDEEQNLIDILQSIAKVQATDDETPINVYSNFQSSSIFIEAVKRAMDSFESSDQTNSERS